MTKSAKMDKDTAREEETVSPVEVQEPVTVEAVSEEDTPVRFSSSKEQLDIPIIQSMQVVVDGVPTYDPGYSVVFRNHVYEVTPSKVYWTSPKDERRKLTGKQVIDTLTKMIRFGNTFTMAKPGQRNLDEPMSEFIKRLKELSLEDIRAEAIKWKVDFKMADERSDIILSIVSHFTK